MFSNSNYMSTVSVLNKGLNCGVLRHQTISNNIANVNTPHYNRKEVTFEGELHRALYGPQPLSAKRTNSRHIKFKGEISLPEVKPEVYIEKDTVSRNDENSVDINQEMSELAKNNLMYDANITSLRGMFSRLKSVIQKGGK